MYRGRFAPSPTGPLHFGSLVAATASYLDAKANRGKWLVRMEDLDPLREPAGTASHILNTLETFGLEWDEPVIYQSQRTQAYEQALHTLRDYIYRCTCSRKEIADSALQGIEGAIYPGTCRHAQNDLNQTGAWRLRTDMQEISFDDLIQGWQSQVLERDIGDFVLKRADQFYSYQLAVVVDDAFQNITHVIRGADLLASTPRQIYLQKLLNLATPNYAHLPVVVNAQGEKLSKQTLAAPLDTSYAVPLTWQALSFLGQQPPDILLNGSINEVWEWAIAHWKLNAVPHISQLPQDTKR
ncbi:MAG TPA: tRNA glutamyl-Q(34) synthetase GluQRS [Methylophilaceae bacterium]